VEASVLSGGCIDVEAQPPILDEEAYHAAAGCEVISFTDREDACGSGCIENATKLLAVQLDYERCPRSRK
jgi:hypothetical protein